MEYSRLGNSSLTISRIGFGCMSLAEDNADNIRLLQAAMDMGINFFDTADLYAGGNNELLLGKCIKEKRKDLVIATKVGNQPRPDGNGWVWNPTKQYILSAVEKSLARLQTDYIDLYQLHGGTMEDDIDETIDAFNTLQQQGKIRYYGISSIRPNVVRAYACRSAICSVMMQYSLLDRRPAEACLPLLADKQIGVLARGALAGGLLVDKPAKDYLNYGQQAVKKMADAIKKIAADTKTSTQIALQFVLQQPAITASVVGIRTPGQLKAAVSVINADPLSTAELEQLGNAIPLNYYALHR